MAILRIHSSGDHWRPYAIWTPQRIDILSLSYCLLFVVKVYCQGYVIPYLPVVFIPNPIATSPELPVPRVSEKPPEVWTTVI